LRSLSFARSADRADRGLPWPAVVLIHDGVQHQHVFDRLRAAHGLSLKFGSVLKATDANLNKAFLVKQETAEIMKLKIERNGRKKVNCEKTKRNTYRFSVRNTDTGK